MVYGKSGGERFVRLWQTMFDYEAAGSSSRSAERNNGITSFMQLHQNLTDATNHNITLTGK